MDYAVYKNIEKPNTVIIMFHGYGSNKEDLISLSPYLNTNDLEIVSLQAPENCDIGFGFQWFGNVFGGLKARYDGCVNVNNTVKNMINHIKNKYNIENKNIILMGFSQGGMVCLHHAFQEKEKYKGLIILSSMFINYDNFINKIIPGDKILACHGEIDDVIPIKNAEESYKLINQNDIEYYSIPQIGHGIDETVISHINNFIEKLNK